MTENLTLRQQANAFNIWRYANPREWNCTVTEIAEATGIAHQIVGTTLAATGWTGRIRADGHGERARSEWEARRSYGSVGDCGVEVLEHYVR